MKFKGYMFNNATNIIQLWSGESGDIYIYQKDDVVLYISKDAQSCFNKMRDVNNVD